MIEDTVAKLEQRIASLSSVPAEKRDELVALFHRLKTELATLPDSRSDVAESITRFAELSTFEATRANGSAALRTLSRDGLTTSVEGFEASHPRLVQVANSICVSLSNLGI